MYCSLSGVKHKRGYLPTLALNGHNICFEILQSVSHSHSLLLHRPTYANTFIAKNHIYPKSCHLAVKRLNWKELPPPFYDLFELFTLGLVGWIDNLRCFMRLPRDCLLVLSSFLYLLSCSIRISFLCFRSEKVTLFFKLVF